MTRAFVKYQNSKGHESGSAWAKNRFNVCIKNGLSVKDTAEIGCEGGIAIMVNTVPASFGMLYHLYSNLGVLGDLRQELSTTNLTTMCPAGVQTHNIDITQIRTHFPLPKSTFQELLRLREMSISMRQVMEDTRCDHRYLLKKDGIFQMLDRVIHTEQEIWGRDADDFNHKRFTKDGSEAAKERGDVANRPSPAAFRAFGGAHTLCPGRHFATTQIMATVTMFIVRYELKPVSGDWVAPTCAKTNIAVAIMEPDSDIDVLVQPRAGFENASWGFGLADSEMVFAVAEEDVN